MDFALDDVTRRCPTCKRRFGHLVGNQTLGDELFAENGGVAITRNSHLKESENASSSQGSSGTSGKLRPSVGTMSWRLDSRVRLAGHSDSW